MIRIIKDLNEEMDRIGDPERIEEKSHKSHKERVLMKKVKYKGKNRYNEFLSAAKIISEKIS
ncbi:MAG: hypothetical protein KAW42_03400, partial [Candidatus Atribacteria bacterium]|nr:hypothetical protein [Candidatus Atribacteria bacterium]